MIRNFRTYTVAVEFYRLARTLQLPRHLKEQLDRAASSIVLNLAEGAGRNGRADRARFYHIAFGSIRECQAILDLADDSGTAGEVLDRLAGSAYRLMKKCGGG